MATELQQGLSAEERKFLVSLAQNRPDWGQLNIPHLADFPAIRWKMQNLGQLAKANPRKFEAKAVGVEETLS
jgi:hypothetical protein